MWFGELATERTTGCILAHGVRTGGRAFKKGHRLSAADVALLLGEGHTRVVVARPDPDDVEEDDAAARLAAALAGSGIDVAAPFTGRVNLFATAAGVLTLEAGRLSALNHVDEGITVATLPALARVAPRQMVATVKIIPFAVPAAALGEVCALGAPAGGGPAIAVAAFAERRVWLIQTTLAHTKPNVLEKTEAVTARRVADLGSRLEGARQCPHDAAALTAEIAAALAAGAELVLVIGASAITDRRDVIPEAIVGAGGRIAHFGMPVDPGNLLLLGEVGAVPVLGLPGCARSPKLNGMDWVLERLAAGLPVSGPDIMDMGIGGLLAEVPIRPQPRDAGRSAMTAPHIAALVLAAGQSRRMGAANKLLAEVDGLPLAAHAMQAARDSGADPVVVVTGHEADRVAELAAQWGLAAVHNPDHAGGLSTSLRAGLAALPREVDAVLVCLGDMPGITAAHLKRLVAAYAPEEGRAIVVPTVAGKRGNPVLWDRRFFPEMAGLAGDVGARHLIGQYEDLVVEVAFADTAPALDIDTPDELAAARATASPPSTDAENGSP
ncbi:MAG: molybdopterin-binding/glycosyltransferase family 2 protein [Rhodospirillaceae bacterium]|nr:molybdopterin-binding/glycosyltransferase family 2 protein [Rhodospirillaceae bacterium]